MTADLAPHPANLCHAHRALPAADAEEIHLRFMPSPQTETPAASAPPALAEADLSFSSELPVMRRKGVFEILDHGPGAVNLARLNNGSAPLLYNHDPNQMIGAVVRASIGPDRKARATVKFSRSAFAQQVLRDVQDGLLRTVSVGYSVEASRLDSENPDGSRHYRATAWTPHEISLVPLPADDGVGVGRSLPPAEQPPHIDNPPQTAPAPAPSPAATATHRTMSTIAEPAPAPAANTQADILALGIKFSKVPEAHDAIRSGATLDQFRATILAGMPSGAPLPLPAAAEIGDFIPARDLGRYSILRAINLAAAGQRFDGLEGEAHQEMSRHLANTPQRPSGLAVPFQALRAASADLTQATNRRQSVLALRTQTATAYSSGGALVPQNLLSGAFIDVLRSQLVTSMLGATELTGLTGGVTLPRKTAASTSTWAGETTTVSASDMTLGAIELRPRRLTSRVAVSRELIQQSSIDVEVLVREDIAAGMAVSKDTAAFSGTGGSQPLGIINTPGIGSVTFSAAATFAKILSFVQTVEDANALFGNLGWVSSPSVKAKLKTVLKAAATYGFIWDNDSNTIDGQPAFSTSLFPTNRLMFGNFKDLLMASFEPGMDIIVDPFTSAASGVVNITIHSWMDSAVRRPESFVYSSDSAVQ